MDAAPCGNVFNELVCRSIKGHRPAIHTDRVMIIQGPAVDSEVQT
jgi:hypothetical protein